MHAENASAFGARTMHVMLNQIFVCMLVFRVVYGLALTAGETLRIPVDSSIVFAPLAT